MYHFEVNVGMMSVIYVVFLDFIKCESILPYDILQARTDVSHDEKEGW